MDAQTTLECLSHFDKVWGKIRSSNIYESSEGKNLWFHIVFQAGFYRILAEVIVGPRGGLKEQVTIVDCRPKKIEVDRLVVACRSTPSISDPCLFADQIGRVNRKNPQILREKIVKTLTKEFLSAKNDPAEYSAKLEKFLFRRTLCCPDPAAVLFVSGGLPRT
ncbi:MAG: hypothetical protein AAB863_03180 [Patescibacteria group bacterium]